jgi:hypothetical protein
MNHSELEMNSISWSKGGLRDASSKSGESLVMSSRWNWRVRLRKSRALACVLRSSGRSARGGKDTGGGRELVDMGNDEGGVKQ